LGLKIANGDFNWGMSAFRRDVFQMIDWLRPDVSSKWMPVNQSNLKFTGIEGVVNWRNAMWVSGLDFSWAFCLLDGKFGVDSGMMSKNALNYLGDHTTFKLNYNINKRVTIGMYYRYFERFESPWSNNNSNRPGYGLMDVKIAYKMAEKINLYMNVLNLLNTQYREISAIPMPPRWIQVGIIVKP
jgi:iron complex outermembrane receptor protein